MEDGSDCVGEQPAAIVPATVGQMRSHGTERGVKIQSILQEHAEEAEGKTAARNPILFTEDNGGNGAQRGWRSSDLLFVPFVLFCEDASLQSLRPLRAPVKDAS